MRRLLAPLTAVAFLMSTAALLLAVGGGAQAPSVAQLRNTATRQALRQITGHTCTPQDYAMQCALASQQPLPPALRAAAPPIAFGVDFAWSCPIDVAASFGASYVSYDPSKDWTRSCVDQFHARHKATVVVFESSANRATTGYSNGFSDARYTAGRLVGLGAPAGQAFDMAIDCDCSGAQVDSYFRGADAAEPGRVNAYGGYRPLLYLAQHHLVGSLNWQTYAWSGGLWLPASIAPLEQYLNSNAVDYDRAIAANYAQFPGPQPPDPFGLFPDQGWHSPLGEINEKDLMLHYIGARAHPDRYAVYLKHVLEPRLHYAAKRILWLAVHQPHNGHRSWDVAERGPRYQFEVKASLGRPVRIG